MLQHLYQYQFVLICIGTRSIKHICINIVTRTKCANNIIIGTGTTVAIQIDEVPQNGYSWSNGNTYKNNTGMIITMSAKANVHLFTSASISEFGLSANT